MGFWSHVAFFFSPACRRGKRVRDLAKEDKQDKELASLTSLTSMPARDIQGTTYLAYETFFSCSNTISWSYLDLEQLWLDHQHPWSSPREPNPHSWKNQLSLIDTSIPSRVATNIRRNYTKPLGLRSRRALNLRPLLWWVARRQGNNLIKSWLDMVVGKEEDVLKGR